MCGIAGVWLKERRPVPEAWMADMLSVLTHRGPDASGAWSIPGLALGNRRLKILDLSDRANQPFTDGQDVLVFNGRIFNHLELKEELKGRFTFETTCDTEVLFRALQVWDEEALTRISGQFAFAFYRKSSGMLMLARDHVGICPLYTRESPEGLVFASEIMPLLKLEKSALDPEGVVDYFAYRYNIQNGRTLFRGIRRFAPAHLLKIDTATGRQEQKRYWRMTFAEEARSEDEVNAEFAAILDREILLQKTADVPVGMYLSGGIDSGALLCGFSKSDARINSFTISFSEEDDDYRRVVELSGKYKFARNEIKFSEQNLDHLDDVVGALEDPFGDLIICANHLLAQTASKEVRVVLSGEGGDEAFCGYDHQKAFFKLLSRAKSPAQRAALSSILRIMPARAMGWLQSYPGKFGASEMDRIRRVVSAAGHPADAYTELVSLFGRRELEDLFSDSFRKTYPVEPDTGPLREIFDSEPEPWRAVMRAEIEQMTLIVNLLKQDRFGMRFSMESCVPLVSRSVLEFAASLPFHVHNSKINKDILLKYSGHRVTRKKPFSLFATQKYHAKLMVLMDQFVTKENVAESGVVSWTRTQRLKKQLSEGGLLAVKQAMAVLVFMVWWTRFKRYLVRP